MRLRFPLLLPFAMGTCLVTSLWAQEREVKQPQPAAIGVINDLDVTVTDLTEEKLNNPPKREIKFERSKDTFKRKLGKPNPKLFEQKYVANFQVKTPANGHEFRGNIVADGDVSRLQYIGEVSLVSPQTTSAPGKLCESFRRMIKYLPPGETIAKEALEFFADPQTIGGMWNISHYLDMERATPGGWNIFVLGATPEEAEDRAKALLALLDQGACRPMQLGIFKKRETFCVQLRDQRKSLEATQRTMSAADEELKSYMDFTPDMLPNLRVQQLQLEIDLAGVTARIAACSRLLAQPALKAERRNQFEDLKIAAEIELSGFEARRTKSEEFIGKVKTKIDLLSKHSTAENGQKKVHAAIEGSEQLIRYYERAVRAYAPLPLVDNKVTVQPLEWTQ